MEQKSLKQFANEIASKIFKSEAKGRKDMCEYYMQESFLMDSATIPYWKEIWKAVKEEQIRLTAKQEREVIQRAKELGFTKEEALADIICDLIDEKLAELCTKELEKLSA